MAPLPTLSGDQGLGIAVISLAVNYRRPAHAHDLLEFRCWVTRLGGRSAVCRQEAVRKATGEQKPRAFVQRKMPRRLKHFSTATNVSFREDPDGGGTVLHLTCRDRPALLSRIAAAIVRQDLQVHSARIATFGEKVEDTFLVSDQERRPLSPEAMDALEKRIRKHLE